MVTNVWWLYKCHLFTSWVKTFSYTKYKENLFLEPAITYLIFREVVKCQSPNS